MAKLELVHRIAGKARITVLEVRPGTSLLAAARGAGLPVARACAGRSLCARCALQVLAGEASLSPESDAERRAKRRNRIAPEQRLACAVRVQGDARLTTGYW